MTFDETFSKLESSLISTTVSRHSRWVASLSASLGLTDAQLNALFVAADKK